MKDVRKDDFLVKTSTDMDGDDIPFDFAADEFAFVTSSSSSSSSSSSRLNSSSRATRWLFQTPQRTTTASPSTKLPSPPPLLPNIWNPLDLPTPEAESLDTSSNSGSSFFGLEMPSLPSFDSSTSLSLPWTSWNNSTNKRGRGDTTSRDGNSFSPVRLLPRTSSPLSLWCNVGACVAEDSDGDDNGYETPGTDDTTTSENVDENTDDETNKEGEQINEGLFRMSIHALSRWLPEDGGSQKWRSLQRSNNSDSNNENDEIDLLNESSASLSSFSSSLVFPPTLAEEEQMLLMHEFNGSKNSLNDSLPTLLGEHIIQ